MKTAWDARQQRHLLPRLAFVIFKIMGLAPFLMENPNKVKDSKDSLQGHRRLNYQFVSSRLGCLYNLCLILVQLCLAYLSLQVESVLEYAYISNLTRKIELTLTISGNGSVVLVWLMYCARQKTLTRLVNRLTLVDVILDGVKLTSVDVDERRSDFRVFTVLFVTNILLWIKLLLSEEMAFHEPIIRWFGFLVPCVVVNWFTVQYVLAIGLIEDRFRTLNDLLLRGSMTSFVISLGAFFNGLVTTDDFREPKIVALRRAHTDLYEISSGVADFYSLPILFTIGFTCLVFLYNAYYFVAPFVLGIDKMTYWTVANSILWLTILMVPITMLVAGVNRVTKEMKKTADAIPEILARPTTSRRDKFELGQFAFELLHKDVQYTGYKFFRLDGTLLQSVFGIVSTYLTIMFQLQRGNLRSVYPSSIVAHNSTNSSTTIY